MLHYPATFGTQAPRKYPFLTQATVSDEASICATCRSRIWTPTLLLSLRSIPREEPKFEFAYGIRTSELKNSVLEGCKWCKSIADGVHGAIFLDELYNRWAGRGSDIKHSSCVKDGGEYGGKDDGRDENPNLSSDCQDAESDDEGWNDASAFNESMIQDDPTGGWDSWADRDTLAHCCDLSIGISFVRGGDGMFTFVNAHIESCDDHDKEDALHKLRDEGAVNLRYYLNYMGSGEKHLQCLSPLNNGTAPGSVSKFQQLSTWAKRICAPSKNVVIDPANLPSRLIHIDAENQNGCLRIVETASCLRDEGHGDSCKFAALSYVWGSNQTFILLRKTQELLTTSFSPQNLPQTIRDAVTVTRRLGLRYLWVDALCIMQDCDDDKAQELPKMRLIYEHAAVTIVAAVSKSANEGFLHHIEEQDYAIGPIEIPLGTGNNDLAETSAILSYPAGYNRSKDPINDRAWTFQELVLSTRAVVFSYRGVQYIDRNSPPPANGGTSGKDPQLPNLPWNSPRFSLNPTAAMEDLRLVWLTARGEYSRRQLSYRGDKLNAIAAIAEKIGRNRPGRYLAGMWEHNLVQDLQWRRASPVVSVDSDIYEGAQQIIRSVKTVQYKDYVAPSWSWASIDEEVQDHAWDEKGEIHNDDIGFEVLSCEVEPVIPGFVYGAVQSAILVAKARVCSFSWTYTKEMNPLEQGPDGHLVLVFMNGDRSEVAGEGFVDGPESDLQNGTVVVCMGLSVIGRKPDNEMVGGLMLLPVDEESFRRVGYFRVYLRDYFEKPLVEVMEVTIV